MLSKLWYYTPICPPPPNFIKSIQKIINNFIWGTSHIHPSFLTSSLSISNGGISLPNFKLECHIRSAKLISQAFTQDPPFWTKQLNHFTITKFSQSLPSCILNHRGTHLKIEPLHSFLNSSRLIETISPFTIPSSPPLPHLRSILLSSSLPPTPPFSPSPHIGPLTWKEIHHSHHPHKIHDLLWKISHQSLPIGIKIAHISVHSGFCPWCPSTPNSLSHMFHSCPFASNLWHLSTLISLLISHLPSPSSIIQSYLPSKVKHIAHLSQSAVLWTIWTSYTSTSFGSSNPSSISEASSSFISILLSISYKTIPHLSLQIYKH